MSSLTRNHRTDAAARSFKPTLVHVVLALASATIFVLAILVLHREIEAVTWHGIIERLREASTPRVALAALCAAAGYATLTGYDAVAMRYIGHRLPYPRSALVAFVAFAVGHNLGFGALSGGSLRYRMYSAMGLSALQITQVIAFATATFFVGGSFLVGASLVLLPAEDLALLRIPAPLGRIAGVLSISASLAYVLLPLYRRRGFRLWHWLVSVPKLRITLSQFALSVTDFCLAAATLWVLVSAYAEVSFPAFVGIFAVAIAAGVLSSVPGGIGVFEAVMLIGFPGVDRELLLGSLLIYRLVYYLVPLGTAIALILAHELSGKAAGIRRAGVSGVDWIASAMPLCMAALVFLTGGVLLISGAWPGVDARLALLERVLPDPVTMLSHLAGSVLGLALLIVARGLSWRLYGAYRLTLLLLIARAAASLLRGLDYEAAIVLGLIATLLWLARGEFHRRESITALRFPARWILAVAVVVVGGVWIAILSHREVGYAAETWWQLLMSPDIPRGLRSAMLSLVLAVVLSLWLLLRIRTRGEEAASPDQAAVVRRIVSEATDSMANAAYIPDKRFLFNADRDAFVMYQIKGRCWIALGDPVGPEESRRDLAWRFRELCDRHDGIPGFYQVTESALPLYVDMGFVLSKLGEEARIPLTDFSLSGRARGDLRQARNRAERLGVEFAIVPREQVPAVLGELRRVSDDWLEGKAGAEKGFSLGRFSEGYLENFDCAVARLGGRIIAFANLWPARAGGELSADMIRHTHDAPHGIMDYLFTELMLWGQAEGYAWFNFGMAPLSGLETHPLAPVWQKVGHLVFQHGEQFYNFEGLRAYKEKFAPEWSSRYLASPGGLAVPRTLLAAAALVSGGLRGAVGR